MTTFEKIFPYLFAIIKMRTILSWAPPLSCVVCDPKFKDLIHQRVIIMAYFEYNQIAQ